MSGTTLQVHVGGMYEGVPEVQDQAEQNYRMLHIEIQRSICVPILEYMDSGCEVPPLYLM